MKVADVWDGTCASLSIANLLAVASRYVVDACGKNNMLIRKVAKTTYIDEDGDEVTFSSNKELTDAFRQVLASYPAVRKVFVVTVDVPIDTTGGDNHDVYLAGNNGSVVSGEWIVE